MFARRETVVQIHAIFSGLLDAAREALTAGINGTLLNGSSVRVVLNTVRIATREGGNESTAVLNNALHNRSEGMAVTLMITKTTSAVRRLTTTSITKILIAMSVTLSNNIRDSSARSTSCLQEIKGLTLTSNGVLLRMVGVVVRLFRYVVNGNRQETKDVLSSSLTRMFCRNVLGRLNVSTRRECIEVLSRYLGGNVKDCTRATLRERGLEEGVSLLRITSRRVDRVISRLLNCEVR